MGTHRLALATWLCLSLGAIAHAQVTIENGGTWSIEARATVRACVNGSCASSSARDTTTVFLPPGAKVNVGLLVGGCAGAVDPEALAGLSRYVPAPGGGHALKLRVAKRQLRPLLAGCTGYASFRLVSATGNLSLASDGMSFTSTTRIGFTMRVSGRTVNATLVVKVQGARVSGAETDDGALAARRRGDPARTALERVLAVLAR